MLETLSMQAQTLFLRDFTVLDFAFLDGETGLSGESLYVSAELDGQLDEKGFILDFGPAKQTLKRIVDEALDHKLVIPALHPSLHGTERGFAFGAFRYEAPAEAVVLLEGMNVTPSLLQDFLATEARAALPTNVAAVRFFLRAEPRFEREANFRYTHGLRLHLGNCQRLLHGHRNPVEVWLDGRRAVDWEKFLAREWDGAHFAYAPTVKEHPGLEQGARFPAAAGGALVEYESPQGFFRAVLPAAKVILLPAEPSIENIARLGVERLRAEGVKGQLRVVAYEGLNKGASFSA